MLLCLPSRNVCFRILGTGLSFPGQVCYFHQIKSCLPSLVSQYGRLLKISSSSGQLSQIHAQMIMHGLHRDYFLTSKLLTQLAETGQPERALLVFNWVGCPNGFLWTSMIRIYSNFGSFKEAIVFYAKMRYESILPNNFSFPSALKACANLKALYEGQQLHSEIVKLGFASDIFTQTSLLDMYVKCSRMKAAKQVFDSMEVKNVVSWTAIVSGYCKYGFLEQAIELFDEMPVRNIVTWNVMIDGLSRFGDVETARSYFDKMPQRNIVSWTIMINGYSRAGDVEKARLLLDLTVEKEVVAWTAMISCYVQNGLPGKAVDLFLEMLAVNLKPDAVTILAVVSAVTELGTLDLSAWIENLIIEGKFASDIRISNAVINMYVRCGSIEKAFNAFEKIPKKDIISYNSMINGFATHGNTNQALSLFTKMIQGNVKPTAITFIGILTACAHGGLVEEGRHYFQMMLDLGYIDLKSEHYSCMVDILSRAGYLDEGYKLIMDTSIKADASVWGALLGACKIHGNLELAEVVAQRLFNMEPNNPGNYAILANMYSEKGMWEAAARMRRAMKESRVFKTPGSSWSEIGDVMVGSIQ